MNDDAYREAIIEQAKKDAYYIAQRKEVLEKYGYVRQASRFLHVPHPNT